MAIDLNRCALHSIDRDFSGYAHIQIYAATPGFLHTRDIFLFRPVFETIRFRGTLDAFYGPVSLQQRDEPLDKKLSFKWADGEAVISFQHSNSWDMDRAIQSASKDKILSFDNAASEGSSQRGRSSPQTCKTLGDINSSIGLNYMFMIFGHKRIGIYLYDYRAGPAAGKTSKLVLWSAPSELNINISTAPNGAQLQAFTCDKDAQSHLRFSNGSYVDISAKSLLISDWV